MKLTPERWQHVARIYELAADQDPATRDAFLSNATGTTGRCGSKFSRCSATMPRKSSWIDLSGQPRHYCSTSVPILLRAPPSARTALTVLSVPAAWGKSSARRIPV